ncbi:hypothetical protein DERP_010512 [Dermatophagoides pteronyssinus]|uniref:Uncharacterized protein n=1 Tax=Dermatophagoides pteronyssinus TaxID=6956 RepID=A0ABQ8JG59_DERPT|nr:hypothetical protein DERP_010512 [Dermatophagoides pteronyssinus]
MDFFCHDFFSATGLCFPILFARSSSSLLASLTTRTTTTTTIPNGIFTNRNHQSKQPNESQNNSYR